MANIREAAGGAKGRDMIGILRPLDNGSYALNAQIYNGGLTNKDVQEGKGDPDCNLKKIKIAYKDKDGVQQEGYSYDSIISAAQYKTLVSVAKEVDIEGKRSGIIWNGDISVGKDKNGKKFLYPVIGGDDPKEAVSDKQKKFREYANNVELKPVTVDGKKQNFTLKRFEDHKTKTQTIRELDFERRAAAKQAQADSPDITADSGFEAIAEPQTDGPDVLPF